MKITQW